MQQNIDEKNILNKITPNPTAKPYFFVITLENRLASVIT